MDEHNDPFFSVVIPTFERNVLLAKCLQSLAPSEQFQMTVFERNCEMEGAKPANTDTSRNPLLDRTTSRSFTDEYPLTSSLYPTYEVIVSDDGRQSNAQEMILQHFPWVRWVQGPGLGPAANRNAGAAVARGTWLVFTDDDCLPQSEWLYAFYRAIKAQPTFSVFEGKTIPDRPRQTLAEHSPVGSQGGNLWSCNFAIRRTIFEQLGGFDPQFRVCMEDNDFAQAVRDAGFPFPFIESALVVHPWRPRSLLRDGWKSRSAELADHQRFFAKYPCLPSSNPSCLLRLGLHVLWCDVQFVIKKFDFKGLPYALSDFAHLVHTSLRLIISK